jgi:hypothetical protein
MFREDGPNHTTNLGPRFGLYAKRLYTYSRLHAIVLEPLCITLATISGKWTPTAKPS